MALRHRYSPIGTCTDARWRGKRKVPIEVEICDIGRGCKLNRKIVANIFQKPLDKCYIVWYNISTREITVTASKSLTESVCGNSLALRKER